MRFESFPELLFELPLFKRPALPPPMGLFRTRMPVPRLGETGLVRTRLPRSMGVRLRVMGVRLLALFRGVMLRTLLPRFPLRMALGRFPVDGRMLPMVLRDGMRAWLMRGIAADLTDGRLMLLREIPLPRLGPFATADCAATANNAARMNQVLVERDMIGSFSKVRVSVCLLTPNCLLFAVSWSL